MVRSETNVQLMNEGRDDIPKLLADVTEEDYDRSRNGLREQPPDMTFPWRQVTPERRSQSAPL